MHLGYLISRLEQEVALKGPQHMIPLGFHRPHSYRGYYTQLAFVPCFDVRLGEMLKDAKSANRAIYEGYKGGSYRMDEYSMVYLAREGSTGEEFRGVVAGIDVGS